MQVQEARHQYERWLIATRNLSPHTIRAYRADIAAFERHIGPNLHVGEIHRDALVGFLEAQRPAGLAASSIKRRASAIRSFCGWLRLCGHLHADPWAGLSVSLGRARKLPRVIPGGDLERLLNALRARVDGCDATPAPRSRSVCDVTTLVAVAIMVSTGVRVSELVQVRCTDIDLVSRRIRVLGKGSRERHVFLTNSWLVDRIRAYLDLRAIAGVTHDCLLFNIQGKPLSAAAMRARLAKAARDAHLAGRVTPHMLRHSAATRLLDAGVDIRFIQRLLGHASLSTTEIYTHVSDETLQRTVTNVDVLGGIFVCR